MKTNFNLHAAIAKQLKNEVITPVKQKEFVSDPNKVTWPYVRCSNLNTDTDYVMRILPSHPGCPDGYVYKEIYTIPYDLDMNPKNGLPKHKSHYVTRPPAGNSDPIFELLKNFYALMNDEEKGEELRNILNTDEEFRTFMQTLSKPWGQYSVPVLLYATCDSEKDNNGYTVYSNYVPDKRRRNYLFRIFQINRVQSFDKKIKANLVPKTFESPEDYEGPINDSEEGLDMKFSHSSSRPKTYVFTECDNRTPLPTEVLNKLAIEGNLCNLLEREVNSNLKTPLEMMNILKSSPYSETLINLGLIN